MRDRFPTGRFACGAFHVNVDPLLVASRFGKLVDAILGDLLATTSATLTPGAVSIRVARPPPGNPITAISVTTRSTGLTDVKGSVHFFMILGYCLFANDVGAACTPAVVDPYILSFGPPQFSQPLKERRFMRLTFGVVCD
jgi:hypothetical protein